MSNRGDAYTQLARTAIESWVRGVPPVAAPDKLAPELAGRRAGAFVSVKKGSSLRGCIGTVSPVQSSLAQEIAQNAIQAVARDPRFPPVTADELHDISISVDVLHAPESCSERDLDPKTYGVLVESGTRRGLLLPDLPGLDSAEQQLAIAKQKAGLPHDAPCRLYRFTVERHTEE